MKKFTKISLIIVAIMLGIGIILGGISSMMGAGSKTLWQMAENGELNYGKWHIGPGGIYYGDDDEEIIVGPNGIYYGNEMEEVVEIGDIDVGDIDAGDIETGISDSDIASVNSMNTTFPAAEIKNMKLSIDAADLRFEEAADAESIVVEMSRGKEKYYDCYMDEDTLIVKYDAKNNYVNNNGPVITITIPSGLVLESLDMDTGAANVTFDIAKVSCKELSIDVGAGNLVAESFEVENQMDVSIGAGNLQIDSGSYGDIEIDCGIGNVELGGKLKGDMTVHCGMGDVDMNLEGKEMDYNYNLTCGMGELKVNGVSYSNIAGSRKVNNAGAIGTINLDCGMGAIELEVN